MTETKAIATKGDEQIKTLSTVLSGERFRKQVADLLPKHLTAERLTRISLQAVSRNQKLLECTPESLLKAILDCARLGLEPTGQYGGAWLVPMWNTKIGANEAILIVDYRGEIALVRRTGELSTIAAHVVYAKDTFGLEYGDDEKLYHKPKLEGEPGEMIGVYAIAWLKDGGKQRVYLTRQEVERYKQKSQTGRKNEGPWATDTEAMWKKTAIRRLCNLLPRSVEYMEHVEEEERLDFEPNLSVVPDGVGTAGEAVAAQNDSAAKKLVRQIRDRNEEEEAAAAARAQDAADAPAAAQVPVTADAKAAKPEDPAIAAARAVFEAKYLAFEQIVGNAEQAKALFAARISMRGAQSVGFYEKRAQEADKLLAAELAKKTPTPTKPPEWDREPDDNELPLRPKDEPGADG